MNTVQQQAQDKLVTAIAFLENARAQGVDAEHEEFLDKGFALLQGLQQQADFGDFTFKFATSAEQDENGDTVFEAYCKGAFYGRVCSVYDGGAFVELADGTVDDADANASVQALINDLHTIEEILWNAEFDDIVQTARHALNVKYSAE